MSNTTSYPPHGLQTVAAFNYWIWSSFGQFLQISPHHSLLMYSFCSTSLVLDGMITSIREHFRCNNVSQIATDDIMPIVSYYLWKQKSGINHLDKCLKHIIGITWESAAVPSITMLIAVSLYYSNSVSNDSSPLPCLHWLHNICGYIGRFCVCGRYRTTTATSSSPSSSSQANSTSSEYSAL